MLSNHSTRMKEFAGKSEFFSQWGYLSYTSFEECGKEVEGMGMFFTEIRWELWMILAAGLISASIITFFGFKILGKQAGAFLPDPSRKIPTKWRGKERRVYPRFPVRPAEVIIAFPEEDKELQSALIVDRSLGGIGLDLTQEVEVGQRLQLRLKSWAKNAPWITAEVRYCRPEGENWRAGCRFVEISPWEVMAIFGPPDSD